MKIKYQIFISSTYEDLRDERDQVIKAILEMGHFPVGMEMFSAANDEQWNLIASQIDESDYYVVIIAHRYGSMEGNISYTEKEYDYAVKQGIPVLGFVISDTAKWPASKRDKEQYRVDALNKFKEKVKRKYWGHWGTANELYAKVPIALMKQIERTPRTGWIRPIIENGVFHLFSKSISLGSSNKYKDWQKKPTSKIYIRLDNLLNRLDDSIKNNEKNLAFEYYKEYCDLLTKAVSISSEIELISLNNEKQNIHNSLSWERIKGMILLRNNISRFKAILESM